MTHIPNTPFGRVLREELTANRAEADGYFDAKEGQPPLRPADERYMKGWLDGRREKAAARAGG